MKSDSSISLKAVRGAVFPMTSQGRRNHAALLAAVVAGLLWSPVSLAQDRTVSLSETSEAFKNPMKGFRPSRFIGKNEFPAHEYGTTYKHYIKYTDLESSAGDSAQKIRDWSNAAWKGIENTNIKVIPRVVLVYPKAPEGGVYWPPDLPRIGIKREGDPNDRASGRNADIITDWTSDALKNRLVRMIEKLGQAWDNDPRVAAIELGLWGDWGEHHIYPVVFPTGGSRIPLTFQEAMGNAAKRAFVNKKVMVRYPETFTAFDIGFIWDSFALPDDASGGNGIMARKVWKTQMISGEPAYNWGDQSKLGKSPDGTLSSTSNTDYVIGWIRDMNASSLGWISEYNQDDSTIAPNAARMQKALGYRYVIGNASFPVSVQPGEAMRVSFNVTNKGNAPYYYKWPVKVTLLRADRSIAWSGDFGVDIRTWLPGQTTAVSQAFTIPCSMSRGTYTLALSVNDPAGDLPSLRFANRNYYKGGWTPVGKVGIVEKAGDQNLGTFDRLETDNSLRYSLAATGSSTGSDAGPGSCSTGGGTGTTTTVNANTATLVQPATATSCSTCSTGQKVGYIGYQGTVQFKVNAASAGAHTLTVYYLSGENRSMSISINGGAAVSVPFASTGGWTTVGTKAISINLIAGANTITFSNPNGYAPDVEKISIQRQ